MTHKINVYTCPDGHKTITRDIDEGVTSFSIRCRNERCAQYARSCFYNCDQTLIPTHEWYKPGKEELLKKDFNTLEHVAQGGLLFRPINS